VADRRLGAARVGATFAPEILSDDEHELEVDDQFERPKLDSGLWIPHYLPQWSSRVASAARFDVGGGRLRLRIDADQPPWSPEFNGWLRVSSLQTGVWAGPLGSAIGQHRFSPSLVVREEQETAALYTPKYGLFEARVRAIADPTNMVAMWMIGFEDVPERSAEICIFEIFGRDVGRQDVRVGWVSTHSVIPRSPTTSRINPCPSTPVIHTTTPRSGHPKASLSTSIAGWSWWLANHPPTQCSSCSTSTNSPQVERFRGYRPRNAPP
jgi:hypothetical protein